MMYGEYHQQQQQQQQQQPLPPPHQGGGGDFPRGGPPPPPLQQQIMRQPSASSTNLNPDFPPHSNYGPPPPYDAHVDNFAARRMRRLVQRRAVDYTSTVVRYLQARMSQKDARDKRVLQSTPAAVIDMLPPVAYADNPSTSFAAKFVHASTNKNKCSINKVLWTPNGRRLITGAQSGEFTLWNGQSFNFEMILQAHDQAIRSMVWSHNESWMVSGDDGGAIKYWQNNMNNVKANKSAHKESIRDLSFSPTDLKFCSCSDDTTVKVWDFARCQEEKSLTGHGWDVKCVDWHPSKSLLVSGGKDNLVKLWDAKTGRELSSFHGHKNTVLRIKWNQNGNWVLTASKDQIIKLYDIRSMKELESFRGHTKDITALAWHPFHEEYFVSGSFDGSIFHWLVGHETAQVQMHGAHDSSVWDLDWHPIGYLLCSGSNDHTTRFWCRNRPGDQPRDRFNVAHTQGYNDQHQALTGRPLSGFPAPEPPATPGPFTGGLMRNEGTIPGVGLAMQLSGQSHESSDQGEQMQSLPLAPPLPPGPHPSLLASGQQQYYQQTQQQILPQQQHQSFSQQMVSLPLPPQNLSQMQPPSHLSMLQHPHLSRPPASPMPPHGMSQPIPSSMPGSMPMPSPMVPTMPGPGPMMMQGSGNQMMSPMAQGHMMGLPQMQSGPLPTSNIPPSVGGFGNGASNMQGPLGAGGMNFPMPGVFNRPQGGFQPGVMDVRGPGMGLPGNMGLPPPPQMPHPHGSAPPQ